MAIGKTRPNRLRLRQKNPSPDSPPMEPRFLLTLAIAMLVSGCMRAGTDYVRPKAALPPAYIEVGPWKEAAPSDEVIRGRWWEIYGDPVLNGLEEQARASSPRVQAAAARVEQARAVLGSYRGIARTNLARFPAIPPTPPTGSGCRSTPHMRSIYGENFPASRNPQAAAWKQTSRRTLAFC